MTKSYDQITLEIRDQIKLNIIASQFYSLALKSSDK